MKMNPKDLEAAADMLKAIAHPSRIAILHLLKDGRRMSVTEIFQTLGIEQAVASHHLRIMKHRGVLGSEKVGKHRLYFLRNKHLSDIIDCVEQCLSEL